MPAPIALFTYKRLDTLRQTVSALQQNYQAEESELFIFSDGPKKDIDKDVILEIRDYLKSIDGFKRITIYESTTNKGLALSIIEGVTKVIQQYDKVIVLEDDLKTSTTFLSYMNQALNFYETNQSIFSIAGFTMPISGLNNSDVYFTQRASSWGWATWRDRWDTIDWSVRDYKNFAGNPAEVSRFNRMGSDMSGMLRLQMTGKINSWAIRWCYHQFKNDLYTVYPAVSKVLNIGLETLDATHTNERFNRFKTFIAVSDKRYFAFPNEVKLEKNVIRQFITPYSLPIRFKYKLMNIFFGKK